MDANQVGYRLHLRSDDGQDCDDCGKTAVVRITVKAGVGVSYNYYCKACTPERDTPACHTSGMRTA